MSLWSIISDKLKEVISKMIGARTIEHELHITPAISSIMEEHIQLWTDLYKDRAYWLHEPTPDDPVMVVSMGIPAMIASEKTRTALLEFKSEITTPTKEEKQSNPLYEEPQPDVFGNIVPSAQPPFIIKDVPISNTARAEFLNSQYAKLKKQLRHQLEYGIAKGGLVIKPYIILINEEISGNDIKPVGQNKVIPKAKIEFDFIQADCFYPLAFESGNIIEAAFIQPKVEHDIIYRRLEYHKWSGNSVQIVNKAYKAVIGSTTQSEGVFNLDLGREIPLTEVPEWSSLQSQVTIKNISRPLFAYFKMPEANTIDTNSPLGISGFAKATKLIREADKQFSRLLWEYEGGELAVDIDRDAMREQTDGAGKIYSARPYLQQRLMRQVDLGSHGDTYYPYAPNLRDSSYIAGLNTILMRIEDICCISRGTLSDASVEAKTATEIKVLKQRTYQANLDIQTALEDTLRDVIYIMDVYCTLYNVVGDITIGTDGVPIDTNKEQWDVSFEWDDSILTDIDQELNKRITLQQNGLASKLENRMWYFGETERQAQEALLKIQDEDRQAMEDNLMMQANLTTQQANTN